MHEHFDERGFVDVRTGLAPKAAIPFRTIEPFSKIAVTVVAPGGDPAKPEKIEFLGAGQQFVAYGIHPDTRSPYIWADSEPLRHEQQELPYIREEEARALADHIVDAILVPDFGYTRAKGRPGKRRKGNGAAAADAEAGGGADDWAALVSSIQRGQELHDSLRDLAAKMIASGMKAGAAVNYLCGLMDAATCPHDDRWRDRRGEIPALIDSAVEKFTKPEPAPEPASAPAAIAPQFSDEALALLFSARHAADLRYVAPWNKWLRYDGKRWEFEETLRAFDAARTLCRELAAQCTKKGTAKAIASAKTVAAVVTLSRADRRQAATTAQWDCDLWLLGTPDGTVNLRTSKLQPPKLDHYITKTVRTTPGGDCPQWMGFLDLVLNHDKELQSYLQRVCGYCLTGVTSEHQFFFFYGKGANGKSAFLSTVSGILGDYHRTASMEMFTVTQMERHPTDLAMLRGARLVTAIETEEGKRWDEAKLKALTGGDPIAARFMRQDFFEYIPQFKFMIAGNHKPTIRNVDEAIRRRLRLIPFLVTIPEDKRVLNFAEKMLAAEQAGILRWMIEGCLMWQRDGLKPPKVVMAATKSYVESQDDLQAFIDQCCVVSAKEWDTVEHIWDGWLDWAQDCNEFIGSKRRLGDRLVEKGYERTSGGADKTRMFKGIRCIRENAKKQAAEARKRADEARAAREPDFEKRWR